MLVDTTHVVCVKNCDKYVHEKISRVEFAHYSIFKSKLRSFSAFCFLFFWYMKGKTHSNEVFKTTKHFIWFESWRLGE